VFTELVVKSAK